MRFLPGIDMSTGSLGQGISCAVGMALAAKVQKKDYRVYTLLGDGEIEEGQVWEAAMFAGAKKLDNLCVIIDNNGLQIDGNIADAHRDHLQDDQGQGRLLHGKCCRLARQGTERAAVRDRHGGSGKDW